MCTQKGRTSKFVFVSVCATKKRRKRDRKEGGRNEEGNENLSPTYDARSYLDGTGLTKMDLEETGPHTKMDLDGILDIPRARDSVRSIVEDDVVE